ncbi:MAG TPA: ATP-binding cassette domain-containing protein [Ktedonobacteraceae bacterium]|nr:ATP-binding cassette domain-containing protein [Ktedonobacteraceae bacterium]
MRYALEAVGLGKRYGKTWALRECTVQIPAGCVAGLIGPGGAGKTTLMNLAMGLTKPSTGSVRIFGYSSRHVPDQMLARVGFVAQNRPPDKLPKGQQIQIALAMALARQPELLLLDEPIAHLDFHAQEEFQQTLRDIAAERRLTVLLSSRIIADLKRICNYLVILSDGRVQVTSPITQLLRAHKLLVVPQRQMDDIAKNYTVLQSRSEGEQSIVLVRTDHFNFDPAWKVHNATLEEIIQAYLHQ